MNTSSHSPLVLYGRLGQSRLKFFGGVSQSALDRFPVNAGYLSNCVNAQASLFMQQESVPLFIRYCPQRYIESLAGQGFFDLEIRFIAWIRTAIRIDCRSDHVPLVFPHVVNETVVGDAIKKS